MTDEQIALCLPLQLLDAPWRAVRAFARRIEAAARREERERACAELVRCAQAAADNNDLRVYELMRGLQDAIRAAYKEPTNG